VAGEARRNYDSMAFDRLGGVIEVIDVMMVRSAASLLALSCLAALTSHTARAEPRAVLELFTSQGCSSCPPADKLMAEFARDPDLIAMSLAVDYWDYLGWKDTLALAGHAKRQSAYAKVRGDREVYTPQIVINGIAHALGSDRAAIERAIRKTRQTANPLSLPVTMKIADDKVIVTVPAASDQHTSAEVWLCPITKSIPVAIGRGENHDHTITYSNVVRRWVKLGDWHGTPETFKFAIKDLQRNDIDSLAVVVQSGVASAPALMLGAAQIAIR
jgi:hypothetical protein